MYALFNGAVDRPHDHLPLSFSQADDPQIGQQVQALLSSAHHLSNLKGKRTQPFEYIQRGPNRDKTTLTSLGPLEYVYALHCMIHDPQTAPEHKSDLANHRDQVVEDGAEFGWEQVRGWSEYLLCKIAQGKLRWTDIHDIRSSRDRMSRVMTGTLFSGEATPKTTAPRPTQRPTNNTNAALKHQPSDTNRPAKRFALHRADTPCPEFNKTQGCPRPDGHVDNGIAAGHHCSWCRLNIQKVHFHPQWDCQIKGKHAFQG